MKKLFLVALIFTFSAPFVFSAEQEMSDSISIKIGPVQVDGLDRLLNSVEPWEILATLRFFYYSPSPCVLTIENMADLGDKHNLTREDVRQAASMFFDEFYSEDRRKWRERLPPMPLEREVLLYLNVRNALWLEPKDAREKIALLLYERDMGYPIVSPFSLEVFSAELKKARKEFIQVIDEIAARPNAPDADELKKELMDYYHKHPFSFMALGKEEWNFEEIDAWGKALEQKWSKNPRP